MLLNTEKNFNVKDISESTINDEQNKEILNSLRIVKASKLNVRKSASKEADKIGALIRGSIVFVIDNKPYWSLVMWQDNDTNISLQGWVATKHLENIN